MKGWRTVALNGLIALLGVVQAVIVDAPLDPATVGYILAGVGAVNLFLRSITDTPVGSGS